MSVSLISRCAALLIMTCASLPPAQAATPIGTLAPVFRLDGMNGKPVALSNYRGKYVVLEWSNDECPFVRHYYDLGDMQTLQKIYTAKNVVWLTMVSSAKGKEGYVAGAAAARKLTTDRKAAPTDMLFDTDGNVGHLYGAKTTPQMFLIDPQGKLIYAGAIDGTPSTDATDIASAAPLFRNALDEALAGKPVSQPSTTPYGCSVKY